jgi:hypothetical protein
VSGFKFNNRTKFWALGMQLITRRAPTHIRQGGRSPMHPNPCTMARVQAGKITSRTEHVAISCLVSQRSAGFRMSHTAVQPVLSEASMPLLLLLPVTVGFVPAVHSQSSPFMLKISEIASTNSLCYCRARSRSCWEGPSCFVQVKPVGLVRASL